MDSVIKLRFHECGNSVNHWNDSSPKEWELLLGVSYVGFTHFNVHQFFVCICDHVHQSSG